MDSIASAKFWKMFRKLPKEAQELANKSYKQWKADQNYPGVNFKPWQGSKGNRRYFEAYVGDHYRAMCYLEDGVFVWFWIDTHEEANKLKL